MRALLHARMWLRSYIELLRRKASRPPLMHSTNIVSHTPSPHALTLHPVTPAPPQNAAPGAPNESKDVGRMYRATVSLRNFAATIRYRRSVAEFIPQPPITGTP
jgi:hypothetical protein